MFRYGIDILTVDKAIAISNGQLQAHVDNEALNKINTCRANVEAMAASNKAVYGINTGFGPLCDTQVTPDETNLLQKNLLISHAVGVGEAIDKTLTKLMLVTKVHALSQGFSGIRSEVIQRIQYFIEHDLLPVVPEQGSVGASGDLAPLAHLFLPLIGEGEFWVNDEIALAKDVLAQHQLEPIQLKAKEGLALINGTQFILAHSILGLKKMEYLLDLADLTGAMSLEGYQGSASPNVYACF